MGAVTSVLWTLVKPGDVVLADRTLYGCTFAFFRDGLQRFGVQLKQVDMQDLEAVRQALQDGARVVYFETPANPNMRLVDIEAVSAMARKAGALTVVDNTYCSPYLQRPLTLGADVVLHSATKYLGGHGDITAGIVVAADAELAMQIRLVGLKDMTGAVLSPHDAHLMLRGLKTLHLRMERHCDNAQELAERLAAHPAIARVDYPGLSSFPQHDLARRQMKRFGGMMSFELKGGRAAGVALMNALELITLAVSLGDAETLTQHPASMTHSTYSPEERAAAGISDGLVRLSAGLEDVADVQGDLLRGLTA
jgi:methionine-gamma-lyase